jgi:hypothetical protein
LTTCGECNHNNMNRTIVLKDIDKPTLVNVQAVLMPNGEVICLGKTIGWIYDTHTPFEKYVSIAK